ncbi:MAG: hypothetical protein KF788_02095 [Piscinibacter sp.]|nr:hypothetical protein [Piscinibacter sp.]
MLSVAADPPGTPAPLILGEGGLSFEPAAGAQMERFVADFARMHRERNGRSERGRAFDPRLTDLFLAHAEQFIVLREKVNRVQPSFADLVRGPRALERPPGGSIS